MTFLIAISNFVTLPLLISFLFSRISRMKSPRLRGWILGLLLAFSIFFLVPKFPKVQNFIFELVEFEDTIYAPNFKERNFRKITENMNMKEVISLLGEPLEKEKCSSGKEVWFYTKQGPNDTNYRVRYIIFVNSRVNAIESMFYID